MKTQIILMSLLITGTSAWSQSLTPQVINATSGGERKGQNFLDWSIGELALVNPMEPAGGEHLLSNGFLQPFEDVPLVVNRSAGFDSEEIRLLPNPTPGLLKVNVRVREKGQMMIRLYDRYGNLLYYKSFTGYGVEQIESVNMTGLINGAYMLRIELYPASGEAPRKSAYNIIKIG